MDEETFSPRFIPVFLTIALLGGASACAVILLTEDGDVNQGALAVAAGALLFGAATWTRTLIRRYPVWLGPRGVRVYGLRGGLSGDEHWLEWSMITHVSQFYFPFIRCLIVRTREDTRKYWIPLGLVNEERFRQLVNQYAGRAHPLTQAIYKNAA